MKLTMLLGASQEAAFDITLYDNSFTRKWVEELRWCLLHSTFNQTESFMMHFTLDESEKILVDSCEVINKYLKNFIEIKPHIKDQSQDYFNYLHTKFEQLSGKWDERSRLTTIAGQEFIDAVRYLNLFVHRIEGKLDEPDGFHIKFTKEIFRRQKLDDTDYDFFEFGFPAGTIYLHYAEIGKDFVDLYQDNLPVNYGAFTNQHHYTGEFSITFLDYNVFADIKYLEWLQSHGIEPYNKTLGHGKIPLGIVDHLEDAISKINKYRHIDSILIKE